MHGRKNPPNITYIWQVLNMGHALISSMIFKANSLGFLATQTGFGVFVHNLHWCVCPSCLHRVSLLSIIASINEPRLFFDFTLRSYEMILLINHYTSGLRFDMDALVDESGLIVIVYWQASLDEPTQSVVMHRTEPSRLQSIALQLSDKVASLVDNNERLMEIKSGNFGFQGKGESLSHLLTYLYTYHISLYWVCRFNVRDSVCLDNKLLHVQSNFKSASETCDLTV